MKTLILSIILISLYYTLRWAYELETLSTSAAIIVGLISYLISYIIIKIVKNK